MPANPKRKSDAARWANHTIYRRTMLVMAILGVGVFLILFIRLYHLQVNRRDELQAKAVDQQTRSAVVTASRGTIYDRNQHVLAISATAETVNISPKEIQDYVDKQIKDIEDATARAIREKKAYTPPEVRDQLYIARGLSRILGIDQAGIEAKMEKTYSMYETLAKKTEQSVSDEIRRFINGEIDEEGAEVPEGQRKRLLGVWLQPDSKRYYPYYELAANIVGFVNGENDGGIGLEAKYDNTLQGTAGMTVTAKSASGAELLYQYEQYYDAENGNDLVLTLDSKIQGALESGMESMLTRFDAKNGGTGIVMEVDTGAIVAMASVPTFDANSYGTLTDEKLIAKLTDTLAKLEEQKMTFETEESYAAAVASAESNAVQTSWRNKCIDSTYEPGSTFKPITLAVALEEGIINMNSTFNCTGSIMVPGWSKPFNCSKKAGHGIQDLKTATGNSCNPAFISIGLSIGTEKYWDYLFLTHARYDLHRRFTPVEDILLEHYEQQDYDWLRVAMKDYFSAVSTYTAKGHAVVVSARLDKMVCSFMRRTGKLENARKYESKLASAKVKPISLPLREDARERALALIKIAHPNFREDLARNWEEIFHRPLDRKEIGL